MALTTCKACKKEIHEDVDPCLHCGVKTPGISYEEEQLSEREKYIKEEEIPYAIGKKNRFQKLSKRVPFIEELTFSLVLAVIISFIITWIGDFEFSIFKITVIVTTIVTFASILLLYTKLGDVKGTLKREFEKSQVKSQQKYMQQLEEEVVQIQNKKRLLRKQNYYTK
ncbi:MAG: hypothetical protein HRT35_13840 [Algicola sp.]|nr:hypothetical protein [Algicola sp.]